ncbi:glycosyl transferase-like sugar-binding protein [Krasilnikovia cinnamomea]|uniref:Glycosyl transferase-like sugar-binding protein n=1 Tax=Krasilnikovia cinnamomea TaxID=349313 RepID=A0A4Q7ZSL1_9ACTN|nr:toxin glutamine deamidase domain-containing protein [Krasilnikovia cinnamomea]RZU53469.1 glycosyl transferase-like sugar-binding protein [Krasilnikovia cinnamomea]
MGMEVDEWVGDLFKVVVGEEWPEADETKLRDLARAWYTFADALTGVDADIAAAAKAANGWEGDAAQRTRSTLNALLTSGSLEKLTDGARKLGQYAENTALTVEYTKASIIGQVVILATQIVWLLPMLFFPPTAPGAAATMSSLIATARVVVVNLVKNLVKAIAWNMVIQVGLDVAIQLGQIAAGNRTFSTWDTKKTGGAAVSAGLAGILGVGLHGFGNKLFGHKFMQSFFGQVTKGALHEWGTEGLSDLIYNGRREAPSGWSASAGAVEGAVDWLGGKTRGGFARNGGLGPGPDIGDITIPGLDGPGGSTTPRIDLGAGPDTFTGPARIIGDVSFDGHFVDQDTFVGSVTATGTFTPSGGTSVTGTFTGTGTFRGRFDGTVGPVAFGSVEHNAVAVRLAASGGLTGHFELSGQFTPGPASDARFTEMSGDVDAVNPALVGAAAAVTTGDGASGPLVAVGAGAPGGPGTAVGGAAPPTTVSGSAAPATAVPTVASPPGASGAIPAGNIVVSPAGSSTAVAPTATPVTVTPTGSAVPPVRPAAAVPGPRVVNGPARQSRPDPTPSGEGRVTERGDGRVPGRLPEEEFTRVIRDGDPAPTGTKSTTGTESTTGTRLSATAVAQPLSLRGDTTPGGPAREPAGEATGAGALPPPWSGATSTELATHTGPLLPDPPATWLVLDFHRLDGDARVQYLAFKSTHLDSTQGDERVQWDDGNHRLVLSLSYQTLTDIYAPLKHAMNAYVGRLVEMDARSTPERFHDAFATDEYRLHWDAADAALEVASARRVRDFALTSAAPAPHPLAEPVLPHAALDALLGDPDVPGFIIGEHHGQEAAWRFLAEHMQDLRAAGVETLYLETIRHGDYQRDVDSYLVNGEMPAPLHRFLNAYEANRGLGPDGGPRRVLEEARNSGMRVVGIDDVTARRPGVGPSALTTRVRKMNVFAERTIDTDRFGRPSPGRYVVLVGAAHSHTHPNDYVSAIAEPTQPNGIPGLSQLLRLPAVQIVRQADGTLTVRPHHEDPGMRVARRIDPPPVAALPAVVPAPPVTPPDGRRPHAHRSGGLWQWISGCLCGACASVDSDSESDIPMEAPRNTAGIGPPPPNASATTVPGAATGLSAGVPLSASRPFGRTGGLGPVDPVDQRALEAATPRADGGSFLVHPDPRVGTWATLVNDGGPTVAGRWNNCADTGLAFLNTWYGRPEVSAPRTSGPAGTNLPFGEAGSTARQETYLGARFVHHGAGIPGLDAVAAQLLAAGPGSSVLILTTGQAPQAAPSHTWAAVNSGGTLVWVDPQNGMVSDTGPIWRDGLTGVWSIGLDAQGRPLHPGGVSDAPGLPDSSGTHEGPSAHPEDRIEAVDDWIAVVAEDFDVTVEEAIAVRTSMEARERVQISFAQGEHGVSASERARLEPFAQRLAAEVLSRKRTGQAELRIRIEAGGNGSRLARFGIAQTQATATGRARAEAVRHALHDALAREFAKHDPSVTRANLIGYFEPLVSRGAALPLGASGHRGEAPARAEDVRRTAHVSASPEPIPRLDPADAATIHDFTQRAVRAGRYAPVRLLVERLQAQPEMAELRAQLQNLLAGQPRGAARPGAVPVPRDIHFVWYGRPPSDDAVRNLRAWKTAAGERWTLHLWTSRDSDAWPRTVRDTLAGLLTVHRDAPALVQRLGGVALDDALRHSLRAGAYNSAANITRYAVLYHQGGIYSDVDIQPGTVDLQKMPDIYLRPDDLPLFAPELRDGKRVRQVLGEHHRLPGESVPGTDRERTLRAAELQYDKGELNNNFIVAPPGSLLMEQFLRTIPPKVAAFRRKYLQDDESLAASFEDQYMTDFKSDSPSIGGPALLLRAPISTPLSYPLVQYFAMEVVGAWSFDVVDNPVPSLERGEIKALFEPDVFALWQGLDWVTAESERQLDKDRTPAPFTTAVGPSSSAVIPPPSSAGPGPSPSAFAPADPVIRVDGARVNNLNDVPTPQPAPAAAPHVPVQGGLPAPHPDTTGLTGGPPLPASRPLGRTGGLGPVDPVDQRTLEAAAPRAGDGSFAVHPDPRMGTWATLVNDGGPSVTGRWNNCADTGLALLSTWYGRPEVSAPRQDGGTPGAPSPFGEAGSTARQETFLGASFTHHGAGVPGLDAVAAQVLTGGPGSSALILTTGRQPSAPTSHTWAALNVDGTVVWVDPQNGLVSDAEPIWRDGLTGVWSIGLDPQGRPLAPAATISLRDGTRLPAAGWLSVPEGFTHPGSGFLVTPQGRVTALPPGLAAANGSAATITNADMFGLYLTVEGTPGERHVAVTGGPQSGALGDGLLPPPGSGALTTDHGPVPSDADWRTWSAILHLPRSNALVAVDNALAGYHRIRMRPETTDQARRDALAAVQEAIAAWRTSKNMYLVGPVTSRRADAVDRLEQAVENERLRLERALTDAHSPGTIRDGYERVAVFSAGALIDSTGTFLGNSLAERERVMAGLRQGATEAEVRIAMLTAKIEAAHERFQELRGEDRAPGNMLALFTAPEWYFKRPGTPFTQADKAQIAGAITALSRRLPDMVIVPGSIMWSQGRGDQARLYNTAIVVMNGRQVNQTNKYHEGMDIIGYYPKGDTTLAEALKEVWRRGGSPEPTHAVDVAPDPGGDSSFFTIGERTFALEICQDHNYKRAAEHFNRRNFGTDEGADVQILISNGAKLNTSVLRPGGIAVSNDAAPQSGTAGAVRMVWHNAQGARQYKDSRTTTSQGEGGKYPGHNYFARQPDHKIDRADQIGESYLGTFGLPPRSQPPGGQAGSSAATGGGPSGSAPTAPLDEIQPLIESTAPPSWEFDDLEQTT